MKESERSLQFKKHFEENKEKGMSIPEMAKRYGLSEFRESSQATISSMDRTLKLMDQALRQWPAEPKLNKEEEK